MYKKILVPIDGSATSRAALDEAARLARLSGCAIELLHVVNDLDFGTGFETPEVYLRQVRPQFMDHARKLLEDTRGQLQSQGVAAESTLIESEGARVSACIVNRARESRPDLIVLGTHGRRGVDRFLLGSDAEQVARLSPVPVMLVRLPQPEAA